MSRLKIVAKEFPFIGNLVEEKFNNFTEVSVKRLGIDILSHECYQDIHSWAGSRGSIAYAIAEDGEYARLEEGGFFSDNGRVTSDDSHVPIWQNFVDNKAIDHVAAILVMNWDEYNRPNEEYEELTLYVRPRHKELRSEVESKIKQELDRLRAIVG